MGCGDKTSQQGSSTTNYTATPEERALEANQLQIAQAATPDQIAMNKNASSLVNQLLTGQQLPGYLSGAMGINDQQTQSMVNQSLKDIYPQFQSAGILDSGTAAQIASRTSADVRNQNAQFNVQALQQLLNQAIGGQASTQQPIMQNNNTLASSLAGLRTVNTNASQTTSAMNPFLKSFQTSLGTSLGNPSTMFKAAAGGGFGH